MMVRKGKNVSSSGELASTLVFYDWEGDLDLEGSLELSKDFFSLLGATANAAAYGRGESPTRRILPKNLEKAIQKPNVRSMEIQELAFPFRETNKDNVYAGFSFRGRKKTAVFSHHSTQIDIDLFTTLTQKFSQVAKITYGHAYLRPVNLGPVMFAYDLSYTADTEQKLDPQELSEMKFWRWERLDMVTQNRLAPFRHLSGMLRDLYPMNVLTSSHVRREICGHPLMDWIASEKRRGYLEEVAEKVWIWVVPPHDLPHLRTTLEAHGLLISRPKH